MLQYLVILLDDTSTSFCHYRNSKSEPHLISLDDLKAGILFSMKENLNVQFVYPDYEIPEDYKELIETIDHCKIKSAVCTDKGSEVVVFNNWAETKEYTFSPNTAYVLRLEKDDFFNYSSYIAELLEKVSRLNVFITDIETFDEEDFSDYRNVLEKTFTDKIIQLYTQGKQIQFNLLTDRLFLDQMNNCNAGWKSIALAPNGKFYVCPAFYINDEKDSIGNLKEGLDIKNPQLYKLDHAPICRNCDAYQCKRCIWLNRETTLEVNTPSHEQCVVAHLERNASRLLLEKIRKAGDFLSDKEIKEIDYLDPFDKLNE